MLNEPDFFEFSLTQLQREREERVCQLVDHLGLDLLVVLSAGARGQRGNVRYVSNYATTSQSSCVLWARSGDPQFLVPYSVHRLWAAETSWIRDIQVQADYPRAIANYLNERLPGRARIGWVGPPWLLEAVQARFNALALHVESTSAQDAFTKMRLIKSPEEVKLECRSGQIADQVLSEIGEIARPGITERDLVAEAEYVARCLGCEGVSVLISRGTLMAQPQPLDTPLQMGDLLQVSIEPEGPGGMWVQTVRMYALGKPAEDWARLIQAGVESEECGAALLREGARCADIAKAMSVVLPGQVPLVTPLGHGIGLDNSEPPRVSRESDDVLASGMTLVLHPTEYGNQTAVYLGNTYQITPTGAVRLSELSTDLVVV